MRIAFLALVVIVSGCAGRAGGAPSLGSQPETSARKAESTQSVLFISDLRAAVAMYPASLQAKNPRPLGSITQGISRADGLWIDRNGTLYVSNETYPPSIAEFERGTSRPFRIIYDGLFTPGAVAVDSALTLYVADAGAVLVYPGSSSQPTRRIEIPSLPHNELGGLAFENNGDLLVATFQVEQNIAHLYRVAPGSENAIDTNLQGLPGSALGTDRAGNIYVGGIGGDIAVYAPGSKAPSRYINAGQSGFYSTFTVTPNGSIYWPNYTHSQMFEFAPGAASPTNVFQGGGVDAAVGTM